MTVETPETKKSADGLSTEMATAIAQIRLKISRTKTVHYMWTKQLRIVSFAVFFITMNRLRIEATIPTDAGADGITIFPYFSGKFFYAASEVLSAGAITWYCMEPCREMGSVSYLASTTGTSLQMFLFFMMHRKGKLAMKEDFPYVVAYYLLVTAAVMFMRSSAEKLDQHLTTFVELEQTLIDARRTNTELKAKLTGKKGNAGNTGNLRKRK